MHRAPSRLVAAAIVCNLIEWLDFVAYGLFAVNIAKAFFPTQSELTSILVAFATFGAAFVMRPIGALFLGYVSDRHGRRTGLVAVSILMAIGTGIVGLTPTYETIGVWAPVLVVAGRLLQGFSVGGDLGSVTALLIEAAPEGRRGFYSSWQMAGQFASTAVGIAAVALAGGMLSDTQLQAWGWRVPFLVGLTIGPLALYIRLRIPDTTDLRHGTRSVMRDLFVAHWPLILEAIGTVALGTIVIYAAILYLPTFAIRQLGLPQSAALSSTALACVVGTIVTPLVGVLIDRYRDRTRLMLISAVLLGATALPIFSLLSASRSFTMLLACQTILCVLLAAYATPTILHIGEIYPRAIRATGMSIGYTLAVSVFGGFGPFIITWLIGMTGYPIVPAWYVMFAAAIAVLTTLRISVPRARQATISGRP